MEKYPDLFSDIEFGIQCGPGWYDLLDELCAKITSYYIHIGLETKAMQVKEKYGGLRFYMSNMTDNLEEIISEAEEKSFEICEECGKPGKLNDGPWYEVRCEECNK